MTASKGPTIPSEGDAAIVRQLSDREGSGLRLLLDRHGARVRMGLRRYFTGAMNDVAIDEVLATATIQAWRHAHTFDAGKGSLGAWFLAIALNAGRAKLRREKRRREVDGVDVDRLSHPLQLVPQPSQAFLTAVRDCVASLPRRQREVIEADLRNGDIVDAAQLAAELGTTPNSIYASRSAGRKALKEALTLSGHAPRDVATR